MMKDLSHLDKHLENRLSAKSVSKNATNQILNSYLNEAELNHNGIEELNRSQFSQRSQK